MATDQVTINIYDLGYSKSLVKDDSFYTENAKLISSIVGGVPLGNLLSGETTGNMVMIDGTYESSNYESGVAGWKLEPDNAYFWNVTISGTLVSSNIHIPDENLTNNSFHTDVNGNSWWGCTHTSFTANNNNALAYILKTGAARFASLTVVGGSIDGTSTVGGRLASVLNTAIDASGHFADSVFSTATSTILGAFTFGASGALQIGTYSAGVSGDIRISPNGILARNKSNVTTFSLDGTTGDAIFGGTITAAQILSGTISSKQITLAITAGTGDSYIAAGKTDFTNVGTAGFILGLDDSDSDKPKFYVGDATTYLNWDGTNLIVKAGVGSSIDFSYVGGATKPANNATVGATWNSNISGQPSDASITNPSYITSTKITATTIETPTITAGTITGTVVQTSASDYTGVKMSSALAGLVIYGQTFELRDTSNNLYGYIGGYGGYYNIATYNNRNMLIKAGSGTVHFNSNAAPLSHGGAQLGYYNYAWANVYALNFAFNNSQYFNTSGSNIVSNSDFSVIGSITLSGNMTFSNYASITIKDSGGTSRVLTCVYNGTLGKYILST